MSSKLQPLCYTCKKCGTNFVYYRKPARVCIQCGESVDDCLNDSMANLDSEDMEKMSTLGTVACAK